MKILKVLLLLLFSAGFVACSNDDDENSSEEYTVGNTPAPEWTVTHQVVTEDDPQWTVSNSSIDLSSSMTLILRIGVLDDAVVTTDDTMAAFIDGICVGVSHVVETDYGKRVFLYVNCPTSMTSNVVSIRYYNATLHQIFNYDDFATPFVTDATYGHVDDPLAFYAVSTINYSNSVGRWIALPDYLVNNLTDNDEIAVFVGDECRLVKGTNLSVVNTDGTTYVQCLVPVNQGESSAVVRYYSAKLKRIFVSATFDITSGVDYRIYADGGFTEMK